MLLRFAPTVETEGTESQVDAASLMSDPNDNDFNSGTPVSPDSSSGVDPASGRNEAVATQAPAAPADPNLAASDRRAAQPAAASPVQDWRSVREAAEAYGYKAPEGVVDDAQFLAHLVQRANTASQSDYYSQVGRALAPHAPKIQEFLRQQQAPAPAVSDWDRPEFDQRWVGLVERDAAGVYVGKPGVPAEIVDKVNRYAGWVERKENDPEGYVAHVASKIVDKVFAERMEQYTRQTAERQAVDEITRANAGWLYQHDDQGNVAYGRDGRPVASPAGQRYVQHVRQANAIGITDPRHVDTYARNMVYAEVMAGQQRQQSAQAQQAANPQTKQARTAPPRNPLQTLPAAQRQANPAATDPTTTGLSLADTLRREMSDLNDDDFAQLD